MLDNKKLLSQRDPSGALDLAMSVASQASFGPMIDGGTVSQKPDSVIIAGMGSLGVVADIVKLLTRPVIGVPIEVVRGYDLPHYSNKQTLVITISHTGNTEEVLSCYKQARQNRCTTAVITAGGQLLSLANHDDTTSIRVPNSSTPQLSKIYYLRSLLVLLQHFNLIPSYINDVVQRSSVWLEQEIIDWSPNTATNQNIAKQIALHSAGKSAVFYGGELTASAAHGWKISWNQSAKNLAFHNYYPEFNHGDYTGWTSHPTEKPFAVFDLVSSLESSHIANQMTLSDRLLSGYRPKPFSIHLRGDGIIQQLLWAIALGDISSIYLAIINNVNPLSTATADRLDSSSSRDD